MNNSNRLLSNIVAFRTYAKHIAHLGRRESLPETIDRNMQMHLDRFPNLSDDIVQAYRFVQDLKVMPSMRSMQFAGEAITKNNTRIYNCSYAPISDTKIFSEALFLLLSGVGFGYSVQRRHISQLPKLCRPRESGIYIIHDSIEGWAESVNVLLESYFYGKIRPEFDFSKIRPRGSYLFATGAKAPGPEPLKLMLKLVEEKLLLSIGRQLTSLEVHDIICIISDCVLAGGIRRAALICGFDPDDSDMLTSKHGNWWEKHPHRARANNSVILNRASTTRERFNEVFRMCQESGCGEPGFSWTFNEDWFYNPCHEIALRPYSFCNLSTTNQTGVEDKHDFMARIEASTLLGTLQASYTDFSYLRPIWKKTTEEDSLLGVSFTGIADAIGLITPEWLADGAAHVLETNEKYAKKLDINLAARTTCVKPEGSASAVVGSASGIHARHAPYYIRRVRMNRDDALAQYLTHTVPELIEDDLFSPSGIVLSIPQESPKGSLIRHEESAKSLLERTMMYNRYWIEKGHRSGDNKHNVSVTISVRDNEWEDLREEMWKNRFNYSGISLLPFDNHTYQQAPFEDCSEQTFERLSHIVRKVDLYEVLEESDHTNRIEQLACASGACSLD